MMQSNIATYMIDASTERKLCRRMSRARGFSSASMVIEQETPKNTHARMLFHDMPAIPRCYHLEVSTDLSPSLLLDKGKISILLT